MSITALKTVYALSSEPSLVHALRKKDPFLEQQVRLALGSATAHDHLNALNNAIKEGKMRESDKPLYHAAALMVLACMQEDPEYVCPVPIQAEATLDHLAPTE